MWGDMGRCGEIWGDVWRCRGDISPGLKARPGAAERAVGGGEATPLPSQPSAEGGGESGAPGQAGAPSSAPAQGQG